MRILGSTALLAVALLLAGCGSSGPKSNGVSAKTADEILADAQTAANSATSVHVSGTGAQGGKPLSLDITIAAGKGGKGHLNVNGLSFDIIRVGPTAYFKGDSKFWASFGGGAIGDLLKGRWLSAPSTTGNFASFTSLTDAKQLFEGILGSHGALTKGAESTVNGQKVIALVDKSNQGILYVSTTGKPYPVKLVSTGQTGAVVFDKWNDTVTITAPANSTDISKLQAAAGG